MAGSIAVYINDPTSGANDLTYLKPSSDNDVRHQAIANLTNYLQKINSGSLAKASIYYDVAAAAAATASGTVTMASVQAADTVTINGVVFTAVSGTPSGNQFDISGTDTQAVASIRTRIAASVTANIAGCVYTSGSAGVLTVYAAAPGLIGNCMTLASSNNTRLAVSGARLTGGTGVSTSAGATGLNYGS